MKISTATLSSTIFSLLLVFSSCTKEDKKESTPDPSPYSGCRIIDASYTLENGFTSEYSLEYDNQGRLIKTTELTNEAKSYKISYSNNVIVSEALDSTGSLMSTTTYKLNDDGLMTSSKSVSASGFTFSKTLEYNSQNQLSKITSVHNGGTTTSERYFYTDDNISKITSSGPDIILTYYDDQPWQYGDPLYFSRYLTSGISELNNANLVKSIEYTGFEKSTYTYDFDNDGKILEINTHVTTGVKTWKFKWHCQ
ncbi:hypothetical protein [Owenweeksia hongkongensis]|uniref:hypothetical protein n=1 Tax=Owenweeksia hongkongensis TaxID=253245 RepID=UPI003A8E54AF